MNIKTIDVFGNSDPGGTEVVHFDQLKHWQNTDLNGRRLANDL